MPFVIIKIFYFNQLMKKIHIFTKNRIRFTNQNTLKKYIVLKRDALSQLKNPRNLRILLRKLKPEMSLTKFIWQSIFGGGW
jgi:hypothetical protein